MVLPLLPPSLFCAQLLAAVLLQVEKDQTEGPHMKKATLRRVRNLKWALKYQLLHWGE